MNTDELVSEMREATVDLQPRLGFTEAVVRGGARRQVRHRVKVATQVAVVCTLVGATTYVIWPGAGPAAQQTQTASPLAGPTTGDLADDKSFLDQVTRTWHAELPAFLDVPAPVTSRPHVSWAGNTPAGRAAVVVGEVDREAQTELYVGLVGTDPVDGQFHLLADVPAIIDPYGDIKPPKGFLFGPDDRTLLIINDKKTFVSAGIEVGPDGKLARDWTEFTPDDGAVIAELEFPAGWEPGDVVANSDRPGELVNTTWDTEVELSVASERRAIALDRGPAKGKEKRGIGLDWAPDRPLIWHVGTAGSQSFADISEPFTKALVDGGYAIDSLQASNVFFIVAGLPDGRTAIVSHQLNRPYHEYMYGVLTGGGKPDQVVFGGELIGGVPLPVRVHLPDGQGWVIADKGATLSYDTGDGLWIMVGRDAALVPENAVRVQAARDGAPPAIVDLKK
jgi:hypothetical protein